jgi:hypothetical protein
MKNTVTFFILMLCIHINGQTLSPTNSIKIPGSADAFRGGYTFAYTQSGTPWNGSLISFGGLSNNYDTQLNSSYYGSDISFRTRNGDNSSWNAWSKIYHSGNLNNANVDFTTKNLFVNGSIDINANGAIPVIRGNGGYIPAGLSFIDDSYNTAGQVKQWSIFKGNQWLKGLGFMRYDAVNRCAGGICDLAFMLFDNGDAQIGNANGMFNVISKMSVQGNMKVDAKLEAKEVKVTTTPTADFVFEHNYDLPKLEDVEKQIKENKHLPEIASAEEMKKEGVNVGEFQIKLLQKIEELTLYSIEQNKKNKELQLRLEKLEKLLSEKNTK